MLSAGWLSEGHPDPQGTRMAEVLAFLEWFVGHVGIEDDMDELDSYGLFWDWACLPQKPRTRKDDIYFR